MPLSQSQISMSPTHPQASDSTQANAVSAPGKPYVVDTGKVRSLHFDREEIQSAMWVARPHALYLEYTRLMMGFLMFEPKPSAIAMIGLGGGSLAKFCHHYLADTRLVAVEIDPEVIALRDLFCVPRDDARWQVIEGDGAAFLARTPDAAFDVLMLDGYNAGGVPVALSTQTFLDDCHRVLGENGVLVTNLHEAHADFAVQAARVRRSFGATLEVREGVRGNCILFAGGAALSAALCRVTMRRPQDLHRDAWTQLKPGFARIFATILQSDFGDPSYLFRARAQP